MRQIDQSVYQGAKNLWGELFEYCSDDASVFSRYKRRCYFQNSDLFGAQRMLLRRIPICHLIAAAIATADRFYWVREHELVQIILHRPNADVKFHSQVIVLADTQTIYYYMGAEITKVSSTPYSTCKVD